MIALSDEVKEQLLNDSLQREIVITFPNEDIADITGKNIVSESLELTQAICDDKEFVLGGCIAGQFTIKVINVEQELNGKRIKVIMRQSYSKGLLLPSDTLYPSSDLHCGYQVGTVEVPLFCGTINSSARQKNRAVKEIVAYDDLYLASQKYVYNYFTSLAIYSPTAELYVIREHLCNTILDNYDYESEFVGFNDSTKLSLSSELVKSVCKDKTTVAELLNAYCELNACFAIMNGEGKIKFIQLINPQTEIIENYSSLDFEEYTTSNINLIKFKYDKDKYFAYGHAQEKKQSWYISDNLITSCCTDISELVTNFNDNSGNNYIFDSLYSYCPFKADVYGRWWLESGDKVSIKTGYTDTETIDSFVFERTLKGTNGMRVSITANGTEYLGKDEINELQENNLD
nr:MAG TPA: hypothetical protein [Bacteriophage sp.]